MLLPQSHPRVPEIRTLATAEFQLPEAFADLQDLSYNFWWSWTPEARMLFSSISPALWSRYHNPIEVLMHVEPHLWETLVLSNAFQAAYDGVRQRLKKYLSNPDSWWFPQHHPEWTGGPVAYFSTEFGLHESLGIYSGGLGVLSGDHCKAASDLGIPFVGVGLLYRRGYFRQTIDAEGRQQHFYPDFDPSRLPVLQVLSPQGRPLVVSVPLLDRQVSLLVYKAQVGRVPVLLLDSDIPQNDPADRPITHILYVRGREMRLCQELVLGVGGVRALRALGIEPSVWHLNEGHSALMLIERLREETARGERFPRALGMVRQNVAFTTHTPVPAGNETFDADLVRLYLSSWATQLGVSTAEVMQLGQVDGQHEGEPFNLTALAIRLSAFRNAVSQKHAEVSREMWRVLFPGQDVPIASITNGVHAKTWLGLEVRDLLRRSIGIDWEQAAGQPQRWSEFDAQVGDEDLWSAHEAQKRRLIRAVRDNLRRMIARQGASPRALGAVDKVLEQRALTIGFARRFALYKRAYLLFRDLGRLKRILADDERPVQFIFAGKAHPADHAGQDLIAQIFRLSQDEDFRRRIVFLEDYDMYTGRLLVQGVDVWLNNPRRPLEASGTSGQKAAVNGALNLSVLDGWWIEGYRPDTGWAIGRLEVMGDDEAQDHEDASSLYDMLEKEVIPLFFEREADDLPRAWIRRMKASIRESLPAFSCTRMVREYTEEAYVPLARTMNPGKPPA